MASQTFGKMLYYPESDSLRQFPSPESLKHQIIISTKPPKEYLESRHIIKRRDNSSPDGRDSSDEEGTSGMETSDNMPEIGEADDKVSSEIIIIFLLIFPFFLGFVWFCNCFYV